MTKKNKDYFETVLKDVVPLKNTNKKTFNQPKEKIVFENDKTDEKNYHTTNEPGHININKKHNLFQGPTKENSIEFLKKIKKRKIKIDRTIDLHGLTTQDAERVFNETINDAIISNTRLILFITGKGLRNKNQEDTEHKLYYGKIRSKIKDWALKGPNKEKILYFLEARQEHGGPGSFYTYLRKKI